MLSVSPTCTLVKSVKSDALVQYRTRYPQLIGDAAESKNSFTKLPDHETASLQEMIVTGGGHGDAVAMDKAATAATPRRS